jgi:hypothetical protein
MGLMIAMYQNYDTIVIISKMALKISLPGLKAFHNFQKKNQITHG